MEKNKPYIDKDIPIEKQIQYLRDKFSCQTVRTYKFFRQEFGDRADELYERLYDMYMEDTVRDYHIDLRNIPFNAVVAMAENEEDKSLGFQPEVIHTLPEEVHTKFGACPYHEAAKRLNFHEPVCTFVCALNAKYISEHTAYQAELIARIAGGDDCCIMKIVKKGKGT
ncbi:MAG: hypothetical protein NT096_15825 [Proteobacteria bacterium]|nr:hypothetical protein [Pseudomonadota bacterium]